MSQLRCIATWGHPMLCQSFSALTEMPVPTMKLINLSVALLWCFYCWCFILPCYLNFHLWPWPLTIWPWTFVMCRQWCDQTLYQNLTKSSNPWRSYCDFSIWPNDLEIVLCCGISLSKFELGQCIHSWLFYCKYIDLWLLDLERL